MTAFMQNGQLVKGVKPVPGFGPQVSGGGDPGLGPIYPIGPNTGSATNPGPQPNPGMPPKPLPGPENNTNPTGLGPIGNMGVGGLSPFGGSGPALGNSHWGSTGTWSSGSGMPKYQYGTPNTGMPDSAPQGSPEPQHWGPGGTGKDIFAIFGGGTLGKSAQLGGLSPYGGAGPVPGNSHWGSTGTWSSGQGGMGGGVSGANGGGNGVNVIPHTPTTSTWGTPQTGAYDPWNGQYAGGSKGGATNQGWNPNGQTMSSTSQWLSGADGPQTGGGGPPSGPTGGGNAPSPWPTFSQDSNLIGTYIGPNQSTRTKTAGGMSDSAARAIAGYQPTPYQSVSPYDPSGSLGNLRAGNDQMQGLSSLGYEAVAGTDMRGAQGYLDAAGRYANPSGALSGAAGAGGMGGFSYAGDTSQVRGMGVDQLKKVLDDSTDRGSLSNDAYQLMLERSAPGEQIEDRRLAQRTAAMGRAGSGMFNSEQMDLATARERTRDQARRELAMDASQRTLDDRMTKLNAASGLGSSMAGQDTAAGGLNLGYLQANNAERGNAFERMRALEGDAFSRNRALSGDTLTMAQIGRADNLTERDARIAAQREANNVTAAKADSNRQFGLDTYGIGRDSYGDQVRERDGRMDYEQTLFNNRRANLNDLSNYEDRLRGYDTQDQDAIRGERGYQVGQEQRAIDNAARQRELEEMMFRGDQGYGNTLMNWGYSQNPWGALNAASERAGQQSSDSLAAAGDLWSQWSRNRAQQGNGSSTGNRPNAYAGY